MIRRLFRRPRTRYIDPAIEAAWNTSRTVWRGDKYVREDR